MTKKSLYINGIDSDDLFPVPSGNRVLRRNESDTAYEWAALSPSSNEDGYVAIAQGGDVTWIDASTDGYVLTWNSNINSWEPQPTQEVGGQETLAETLAFGNTTDGINIDLNSGSQIVSSDGDVIVNDNINITGDGSVTGDFTIAGKAVFNSGTDLTAANPKDILAVNSTSDALEYISAAEFLGIEQESIPVLVNGQQAFTLSEIPIADGYVMMFLNGMKQQYGVDYVGVGTSITYNDTDIVTSDVVEFYYNTFTTATAPPGGIQTLADTLLLGNVTGGTDIVLSSGDSISNTLGSSLNIQSVNNGGGPTDDIVISSGDSSGDSGNIFLRTGSSGSTRGLVNIDGDGYVSGNFAISGKLDVDGLIDPTGLVLNEQVTKPYSPLSNGSNEGLVWVRDDGYFIFTNQNDVDFVLGEGGEKSLAETLAVGNNTGGNDIEISGGDILTSVSGNDLNISTRTQFGPTVSDNILLSTGNSISDSGNINIITGSGVSGSGNISINTSSGNSGTSGGIDIYSGNGDSGGSGDIYITSGSPDGGSSGDVTIGAGFEQSSKSPVPGSVNGGNLLLKAGDAGGGIGGSVTIEAGNLGAGGVGDVNINTGTNSPNDGGDFNLTTGTGASGTGGDINLIASFGGTGGGDINIISGFPDSGFGSGVGGDVTIESRGLGGTGKVFVRARNTPGGASSSDGYFGSFSDGSSSGDIYFTTEANADAGSVQIGSRGGGSSGEINIFTDSPSGGPGAPIRMWTTSAGGGGDITIESYSPTAPSGNITISTEGSGQPGDIDIHTSAPTGSAQGGNILIESFGSVGGDINIRSEGTGGPGGKISLVTEGDGLSNDIDIITRSTAGGPGGVISMRSISSSGPAGPINLTAESFGAPGNELLIRNFSNGSPAGDIRIQTDSDSDASGNIIIRSQSIGNSGSTPEVLVESIQDDPSVLGASVILRTSCANSLGPQSVTGITIDPSSVSGGGDLSFVTSNGFSGSSGDFSFVSGAGDSGGSGGFSVTTGAGGALGSGGFNINTGSGSGGASGSFNFTSGSGDSGGSGSFNVTTGPGGSGSSGDFNFTSGEGNSGGSGSFNVTTGPGQGGNAGDVNFTTGYSPVGIGGSVNIIAGSPVNDGSGIGGDITIESRGFSGTGKLFVRTKNSLGGSDSSDGYFGSFSDGGNSGDVYFTTETTAGASDSGNVLLGSFGTVNSGSIEISTESSGGSSGDIIIETISPASLAGVTGGDVTLSTSGGEFIGNINLRVESTDVVVIGENTRSSQQDGYVLSWNSSLGENEYIEIDDDNSFTSTVQTTDATVTPIFSTTTLNDTVIILDIKIIAMASSGTNNNLANGYKLTGIFKNNGGTLTQVGTTSITVEEEEVVAWNVGFNVSASDIEITVTGDASTTVEWLVSGDVVTHNG